MLINERGRINERIYLSFAGFFPGFVIFGEKTALIDAGVPPIGPDLYKALKAVLGDRPLDYIFLTHSHYDHCGAIPYIKKRYPGLEVVGSEISKKVLLKPEARAFMENLSKEVEGLLDFRTNHPSEDISLMTDLLDVDVVVKEGDVVDLGGGVTLRALENPGHSRCSLAYYMESDHALFAGEGIGAYVGEEGVMANYLSDYNGYITSIGKIAALPIEMIGLAHHGMIVGREESKKYFEDAIKGALEFREIVGGMIAVGKDEQTMVKELTAHYYHGAASLQPYGAFKINLKAMIKVIKNLNS